LTQHARSSSAGRGALSVIQTRRQPVLYVDPDGREEAWF